MVVIETLFILAIALGLFIVVFIFTAGWKHRDDE